LSNNGSLNATGNLNCSAMAHPIHTWQQGGIRDSISWRAISWRTMAGVFAVGLPAAWFNAAFWVRSANIHV